MGNEDCFMYSWSLRCGGLPPSLKTHLPKESERVVKEPDCRKRVDSKDLGKGGEFRSVVKVLTVLNRRLYGGTGWLIRDDLMVTAGHNVVDASKDLKTRTFATNVIVYIGYSGKDAMDSGNFDIREGALVVVPRNYAINKDSANDFAFVQLSQPFYDVSPIKPLVTPTSGNAELCVVGYPTDKTKKYLDGGEEDGAEMYEERTKVTWHLEDHGNLLAYQISTFRGNSGSPVLYEKYGTTYAIGTYVVSEGIWNFASLITEKSVNSYHSIIDQFFSGTWPEPHETFVSHPMAERVYVKVHRLYPQNIGEAYWNLNLAMRFLRREAGTFRFPSFSNSLILKKG